MEKFMIYKRAEGQPIGLPQRKHCPFCGSEKTRYGKYADSEGDFYCVECLDCWASGPITRLFQDTALELWNADLRR